MRRYFAFITAAGTIGMLVLVSVGLSLMGGPYSVPLSSLSIQEPVEGHAVELTILGLFLTLLHLLAARGSKRGAYRWFLLWGTLLVLFSLDVELLPGTGPFLSGLPIFRHDGLSILLGALLLGLGRFASLRPFAGPRGFALLLPAAVAALLLVYDVLQPDSDTKGRQISYDGELAAITEALDPAFENYRQEIERYLSGLLRGQEGLSREEQRELVERLNRRIAELERELDTFDRVRRRNREYEEEIRELAKRLDEIEKENPAGGSTVPLEPAERVESIAEAVRPSKPLVRDFAVKIASAYPGPYTEGPADVPAPTRTGIKQIVAIHHYLSSRWSYVSDPLFRSIDYYSPAERTISVGLAGDCDDFAILMASCIEAVGGRVRIVGGSCAEGGHAWAEVYLGSSRDRQAAYRVITDVYPDFKPQLSTSTGFEASCGGAGGGGYWLSLDWELGRVECGENRRCMYHS